MQLNFDATKYDPTQGTPKHPTGKFPASVSDLSVEENKNKDGGYLHITFTTPAGQISKNYNLWFTNPNDGQKQAIEIAQKQLAALCYATGVFKLNDGRELINARLQIEVTPQVKNAEYNEVSKVYDANGNEPGKTAAPAAANGGGWGAQPAAPTQQGWQAPSANTAPATAAAPAAWQPGPSAPVGEKPPWAK